MQNYSSTYAKLAMFGFAAWGGAAGGGVVAGITMGALVWCIAFSATEMLQVRPLPCQINPACFSLVSPFKFPSKVICCGITPSSRLA